MQIEKMKLADLKPAVYNPRVKLEPGMDEYEKLKKSLQEFGFVDPPIFNKQTGNLVGGHQRVTVAQKIALCDEIEVSVVDLSLEKEKALNLALNKISGKWDDTKLALLLKEFEKDELDFTGFDQTEADDLINQFEYNLEVEQEVIEDEFDIEQSVETIKQNEPKTNYGDVWQLGSHRLMCGDATITIHVYVKNKSETEVYSRTHKAMTDFSDKVNKTVSLNMNGVLDGGQNTGWIQFLEVFNDNLQTTLDDDANG